MLKLQNLVLDEPQSDLAGTGSISEPDADSHSVAIYFSHHLHLMVFLVQILLVDTNGINPKVTILLVMAKGK
jgi:hypothetical protein